MCAFFFLVIFNNEVVYTILSFLIGQKTTDKEINRVLFKKELENLAMSKVKENFKVFFND